MLSPQQKEPSIYGFYFIHRSDQLSTKANINRNTMLIYGNIKNQKNNLKLKVISPDIENGYLCTKVLNF